MAIEPAPDMLLRLHTSLNILKARRADLEVRIRQRRAVEVARLKRAAISRGRRSRNLVLGSTARHAAILAGADLELAVVAVALDEFARAILREISADPGRQGLEAEVRPA